MLLLLLLAVVVSTCFLEPFNIDLSPGPAIPEATLVVVDEVEGTGREVEDPKSSSQLSAGATKVGLATFVASGVGPPLFLLALGAALVEAPVTAMTLAPVGMPFFFESCGTLFVVTVEVIESRGEACIAAGGRGAAPAADATEVSAVPAASAAVHLAAAAAVAAVAAVLVAVGQAYALWPCSPHVKQALRATKAAFSEAVSTSTGWDGVRAFLNGAFEQRARSVALSSGYSFFSRPICQQQGYCRVQDIKL